MVLERGKLLHLVHLRRFQQLGQADTGSFAARTLLIGASPAQELCPAGVAVLRTRRQLRISSGFSACSILSVFLDSFPQLYLHKGKSCVPRAAWQHSFPSMGFF